MKSIFEKPLILNGEEENVVLVYSKYIIGNIKKEIADLSIEGIDKDLLNPSRFESIVKIKEVFGYKFKPGSDSHITFGVKNVTGVSYKTIGFKDAETTKQAEITLLEHFEKLGFKRKEKQFTRIESAMMPFITTLFIGIAGGMLTWFSFMCQKYDSVQIRTYNWCFNILIRVCRNVGYIPFLITTTILLTVSLLWLFKRILKPPYQISAIR
ncbi:hypothetical protein GKZ90_0009320 [Flavobacterium sp. MC2016-06]|uniref:hypothetical protein n=1 Tax=Flavobacterium sp. MC2016-06 TaxID=2676308 RepID=UPI0012BA6CCC|nr:hypothetical protein [Flavobacterium sp. MC2016-06]MBU3859335.1 hypothetical protein [Flavobacterium sp. MC2016-06]